MTRPSHAALVEEVAAKIATHDMFDESDTTLPALQPSAPIDRSAPMRYGWPS